METPPKPAAGQVIALFKLRVRADVDGAELSRQSQHMTEIATAIPGEGLLAAETWSSPDGATLVVYRFSSMASLESFIHHPDHQALMRRGSSDEELAQFIRSVVEKKEARHHIGEPDFVPASRTMVHIGG